MFWTSAFEGSCFTLFDEWAGKGALLLFPLPGARLGLGQAASVVPHSGKENLLNRALEMVMSFGGKRSLVHPKQRMSRLFSSDVPFKHAGER